MCEVILNPVLLIVTVVIYSLIVLWINKLLIRRVRIADNEVFNEAIGSPNVDREIWQSEKNEEILKNVFISVIKKPISQWKGIHVGIVSSYFIALGIALLYFYFLLFKC